MLDIFLIRLRMSHLFVLETRFPWYSSISGILLQLLSFQWLHNGHWKQLINWFCCTFRIWLILLLFFFYSVPRLLAEIVDNFRCCCFFALFKLFALLAPISFKCIMNVLNSQKRSTTLIMKFPHKFACKIVHQSVDKKNIHEKETETSIQAADAIDTTHLVTR